MEDIMNLFDVLSQYELPGKFQNITENSQGNINKTFVILLDNNNKYLLQKINSNVFKEPYLVMKNIELVTDFLRKKLEYYHDAEHKTLNIIKTKEGDNLCTIINSSGEKESHVCSVRERSTPSPEPRSHSHP